MANAIYPKGKAQFLQGGINMLTADIRVILIDAGNYTYNAAHEFLSDVPSLARVALSSSLTGKTIDAATAAFKSDFKTLGAVTGAQSEALILYVHTGNDATARLVSYHDAGISGLPVTPDGSDIKITPAPGGWFQI